MSDMIRCSKCATFHYRNDPCPDEGEGERPTDHSEDWMWEDVPEFGEAPYGYDM